jgi:hypothetical protein
MQICVILGYYAAYSRNSLQTFRDNMSVPSSSVRKHPSPKTAKTAPIGRLETSVRIYHSRLREVPERLHRGGSLQSGLFQYSYNISNSLIYMHMSGAFVIYPYKLPPRQNIIFNYRIF